MRVTTYRTHVATAQHAAAAPHLLVDVADEDGASNRLLALCRTFSRNQRSAFVCTETCTGSKERACRASCSARSAR